MSNDLTSPYVTQAPDGQTATIAFVDADMHTANSDISISGADTLEFPELADGEIMSCTSSLPDGDEQGSKAGYRGLPSRNIVVDGKRTSIRLDEYSLKSLYQIAEFERISINELCTLIHERHKALGFTLTAAIRVFMLSYFRSSATEEGHRLAGHGRGRPLTGTPFDPDQPAGAGGDAAAVTRRSGRGPASSPVRERPLLHLDPPQSAN